MGEQSWASDHGKAAKLPGKTRRAGTHSIRRDTITFYWLKIRKPDVSA
jgi:hypothetical protein